MQDIKITEGNLIVNGGRFAIVAARFNDFIVDKLVSGAIDTLLRHGAVKSDIEIFKVPGAVEIPLAAAKVAETKRFDAIIALGAVIRGATPHFEYVAGDCSSGLCAVGEKHAIPVAFGVLTVDTIEQAVERAGTKAGNKGSEAAMSAIEMVNLLEKLL